MNTSTNRTGLIIALLFLLGGCAGSAPRPQFTDAVAGVTGQAGQHGTEKARGPEVGK